MSESADGRMSRGEELLCAYHDGELKGLARRRFERQLRQSPELREELGALDVVRHALSEIDAEGAAPDLWDDIAPRLPAADARRREGDPAPRRGSLLGWLFHPVGASLAVAAAAAAVAVIVMWPTPQVRASVVQWVDGGGHSVMVLDREPDTTIIWMFDGAVEEVSTGGGSEVV